MPHSDPERRKEWEKNRPYRDRKAEHRDHYWKDRPDDSRPTYGRKKFCIRGHDLTIEANVYLRPSGSRECRVCKVAKNKTERKTLTAEQQNRRRETSRMRCAERRARRRRVFVERVNPTVVFERDRGVCGICGTQVSRDNFHVDHVIPLDPGEHSYANVQLAHSLCNIRKGRKI